MQSHESVWRDLEALGYNEKLELKEEIAKLQGKEVKKYHPLLAIYSVANIMKSLIVSVMQTSENEQGSISLHYRFVFVSHCCVFALLFESCILFFGFLVFFFFVSINVCKHFLDLFQSI